MSIRGQAASTTRHKRKKADTSTDDSWELEKKWTASTTASVRTRITITRSPDFWFDDGTIVLQVKTTQFRVHRGVLGMHSAFFADMFRMPQPNYVLLVEGCQVVVMHDKVEDWEHMLMVMYQPIKTHPLSPKLLPSRLVSMLRLGKKYQFDVIYDEALTRLKSELPSSFDDSWAMMCKIDSMPEPCGDEDSQECGAMVCCTGNLFKLINVAVELNVRLVLPVAYYLACSKDIQTVLNGCRFNNGTVIRLAHGLPEIILVGRDRIRKAIMDDICPWVFGTSNSPVPSKECQRSQVCLQIFNDAIKESAYSVMQAIDFDLGGMELDELCRSCHREVTMLYIAGRAHFWEHLPSYFDLRAWNVLEGQ